MIVLVKHSADCTECITRKTLCDDTSHMALSHGILMARASGLGLAKIHVHKKWLSILAKEKAMKISNGDGIYI